MSVQLAAFFLPGRCALLLALLALDGLCSCAPEATTCDDYRSEFFDHAVNAIVTDRGSEGRHFILEGVDPVTHQLVRYSGDNGMYITIRKNLAVGDTLLKRKGESLFTIKKRGANVLVDFDCKRDDYVNVVPKRVRKTPLR